MTNNFILAAYENSNSSSDHKRNTMWHPYPAAAARGIVNSKMAIATNSSDHKSNTTGMYYLAAAAASAAAAR
jgi:hypothetical protein